MTESNEIIGYLVWWRLWEMNVNYDAFQSLIRKVGISFNLPPLKHRTAFLKAVQDTKRSQANKGILVRKLYKAKNKITVSVVDEYIENISISYSNKVIIDFDPVNGKISCSQPHRGFDFIQALYYQYLTAYNVNDVRVTFVDMMKQFMPISFRQNGGLYFLDKKHFDFIQKMEKLVSCLPGKSSFFAIPQINNVRTKRAMSVALEDSLDYQLALLQKELSPSAKRPDGLIIPGALYKRRRHLASIYKQILSYKDILFFDFEKHAKKINELDKEINRRLCDD